MDEMAFDLMPSFRFLAKQSLGNGFFKDS